MTYKTNKFTKGVYNTNRDYLKRETQPVNTKPLNNIKKPLERVKFKIDKSLIKGETQYSLLYFINETDCVWIPKTMCFGSLFTNWLTVWPSVDYKFRVNTIENNETKFVYELTTKEFKKLIEEEEVNKQWI